MPLKIPEAVAHLHRLTSPDKHASEAPVQPCLSVLLPFKASPRWLLSLHIRSEKFPQPSVAGTAQMIWVLLLCRSHTCGASSISAGRPRFRSMPSGIYYFLGVLNTGTLTSAMNRGCPLGNRPPRITEGISPTWPPKASAKLSFLNWILRSRIPFAS